MEPDIGNEMTSITVEPLNSNLHKQLFNKLKLLKHKFLVVFGKEFEKDFNTIFKTVNQIFHAGSIVHGKRNNSRLL